MSFYRQQAENNEQTARAAQKGFPDWAVIMCFYAALHWVNHHAYTNGNMNDLTLDKINKKDKKTPHDLKRDYVQKIARQFYQIARDECKLKGLDKNKELEKIKQECQKLEKAYEVLFYASMTARYLNDLTIPAREYFSGEDIEIYFDYLKVIKEKFS